MELQVVCWGLAVLLPVACWPSMRLLLLLKPWEVLNRLYTIDHTAGPDKAKKSMGGDGYTKVLENEGVEPPPFFFLLSKLF